MFPQSTMTPDLSSLDKKIRPLVRCINNLGIPTFFSCEGHAVRDAIQSSFPLVVLSPSLTAPEAIALLRFIGMIGIHNSQKDHTNENRENYICWDLTPKGDGTILLKPQNQDSLDLLLMHRGLVTLVKNLKLADRWYQTAIPFAC